MKTHFLKYVKSSFHYLIFTVAIPNMIWFAIWNIPMILGLLIHAKQYIGFFQNKNSLSLFWIIFLLVSVISLCVFLLFNIFYWICRFVSRKNRPRFPKFNFSYRILGSEYELYFKDRDNIVNTQEIEFCSAKQGLKTITHTLNWTGQEYVCSKLIKGIDDGVELDANRDKRDTSPFYISIKYPNEIALGDKKSYSFSSTFKDGNHSMHPFFCKTVKCQTDKLTLRISVPPGIIKNVYSFVATDCHCDIPIEDKEELKAKRHGNLDVYEITKENLNLLFCYGIVWNWVE